MKIFMRILPYSTRVPGIDQVEDVSQDLTSHQIAHWA